MSADDCRFDPILDELHCDTDHQIMLTKNSSSKHRARRFDHLKSFFDRFHINGVFRHEKKQNINITVSTDKHNKTATTEEFDTTTEAVLNAQHAQRKIHHLKSKQNVK